MKFRFKNKFYFAQFRKYASLVYTINFIDTVEKMVNKDIERMH